MRHLTARKKLAGDNKTGYYDIHVWGKEERGVPFSIRSIFRNSFRLTGFVQVLGPFRFSKSMTGAAAATPTKSLTRSVENFIVQ